MKCAVSACLVGYGTGAYDPWAPTTDNFSISSISVYRKRVFPSSSLFYSGRNGANKLRVSVGKACKRDKNGNDINKLLG